MNKRTIFFCLFLVLIISCEFEPIGLPLEKTNEETEFETGAICNPNGEYGGWGDELLDFDIPVDLPDNFDLSHFLPPVRSQGKQGSCVSWAISYYLKSLQEKIEKGADFTINDLTSPAYTYNQITQGSCTGTQLAQTLELLKNKGVCTWNSFPYTDTNCKIQPTDKQDEQALQNRISDYKSLSGENMVNEMKGLIYQRKPIVIAAYLSSEFGKKDRFGLTAYREHQVDYSLEDQCHAMLVVGYSDEYKAFKVVNSWGIDWGDDGFVWIDYAAFDNVLNKSAKFRVINQAYVTYDLE